MLSLKIVIEKQEEAVQRKKRAKDMLEEDP